jgi:hypothetical protein
MFNSIWLTEKRKKGRVMKTYVKSFVLILLTVVSANLLVEFAFEQSIQHYLTIKFFVAATVVSIIGAYFYVYWLRK